LVTSGRLVDVLARHECNTQELFTLANHFGAQILCTEGHIVKRLPVFILPDRRSTRVKIDRGHILDLVRFLVTFCLIAFASLEVKVAVELRKGNRGEREG
jgi:hypothetical protein